MGRNLRTVADSNIKKKSTLKKFNHSDSGLKMTQKTCEKLKSEIELNKIKKDVAIKFRKNIELKIDILKLNISYLIEEVSRLKTLNEELSYKSECFTSVCDKLPENLQSTYSEQAQPNNYVEKKTENVKYLPSVVLMPNNRSNKSKTMKKFFIGEVYGKFINQLFELDSEEPFQIFPLETDAVLTSEELDKLKKIVLKSFDSIGTADIVPYVSLSKKDMELKYLDDTIIDLTEKEDCEHVTL